MKEVLNAQQQHWEKTFFCIPDMFGAASSDPARFAVQLFRQENKKKVLELGGGQGRDTLLFARSGFQVDVLDYAESGVQAIREHAGQAGLSGLVTAQHHDVREPLPFGDQTFDGCYAHMLYCMTLTTSEQESLTREVGRVLRPNGLHIYTVRNNNDPQYKNGIHRGEDMYEIGGFIIQFFTMQKIEQLTKGFELVSVDQFEEGNLPRKLYCVVLRKK